MVEPVSEVSPPLLEDSSRLLARAFQNDPLFRYALPADGPRQKRLPGFFALTLRYGAQFGEIYAIPRQGLALWLPPGKSKITLHRALQAGMWLAPLKIGLLAILRLGRLTTMAESLHERFAPGPHWYLFLLGVDPASQGRGQGGRLLQPVLSRADAAYLPCYLETNNPSAVRFYQKHGFAIAAQHQSSPPGLCLWAMRRESR